MTLLHAVKSPTEVRQTMARTNDKQKVAPCCLPVRFHHFARRLRGQCFDQQLTLHWLTTSTAELSSAIAQHRCAQRHWVVSTAVHLDKTFNIDDAYKETKFDFSGTKNLGVVPL